jgi:hypothetical protein
VGGLHAHGLAVGQAEALQPHYGRPRLQFERSGNSWAREDHVDLQNFRGRHQATPSHFFVETQ